jgi:hypothetical protein
MPEPALANVGAPAVADPCPGMAPLSCAPTLKEVALVALRGRFEPIGKYQ